MPQYRLSFLDQNEKQLGSSYLLAAQDIESAAAQATRYDIPTLTAFLKVEHIADEPFKSILRPFP
jgi:hypothetical protein